eukprot:CAMPEP_0170526866 /NCGR_PEP_ID=MMETSP0209-20121228/12265_1 /TAXON_ID=665100 ORGANISM="Litonotus pictus, Strain P1" /NCGR_SAMPLE_ID=MMETSP0209 /ASSEMBLY_ACC=CAM_ASM_000301 /LENGTH=543 /DNA_ID=CAMNT_0010816949 /DNA_START=132 /DNA_END=1760 /DNA_ORIENTATION=-
MKSFFSKSKPSKKNLKSRTLPSRKTASTVLAEKPDAIEVIDKSKIITEFEKLKVSQQNWLKISTPEFKNPSKFPTIALPDYKSKKIRITTDNFRINELFDAKKPGPDMPPEELYFWFRISDKNIYYSSSKGSLNVMGSIPLKKLVGVNIERRPNSTCFEVADSDNNKWKLCAETKVIRHAWVCYIKGLLGIDDQACKSLPPSEDQVVVEDQQVTDPVILIPLKSMDCNEGWNYSEKGAGWNCKCSEGNTQSPIDIDTNKIYRSSIKPVFKYDKVDVENEERNIEYKHGAIRIEAPFGKTVTLDGNIYKATEIVFHTPSQHKIDGRHFDMEMEIIHVGESADVIANHLILSIMFEAKPGVYNKFFDEIDFFNLPNPMFKKRKLDKDFNINKIFYSITDTDYPSWKNFSFFTYEGSLTSPPCSEKTIYYVKREPIPLGNTTLQLFREAIKVPDTMDEDGNVVLNTAEAMNIREVQPLNGRRVYSYEYSEQNVLSDAVKESKPPAGHYEKVSKKMIHYFHVNTDKPSGLPGSFVISEALQAIMRRF